jgi:Lrp/AsnC family transcriptional regulator
MDILMQLDDTDRRLLRALLAEPELVIADLAERSGMSAATFGRRLEKLVEAKVILRRQAVINWVEQGYTFEISLRFTLDKTDPRAFDQFIEAARLVPEVIEIQTFLGRVDVRLSVIARDLAHYQHIYRNQILTLPHIAEIEALMHIASIKQDGTMPI